MLITEGATVVTTTPDALVTAAAGAAGTEGATVTAQPAPLVTLAAGGAAAEGATFAGAVPTVDATGAPVYGPQLGPQVPAVPQVGQTRQGDGESVPLLQAMVMELRKLNRAAEGKPQGAEGRRARREQNEPAPHVLDGYATLGAVDAL